MQLIFKSFRQIFLVFFASFFIISFAAISSAQNETKDPVETFNQGQAAHEKGDLQTALKLYEEALKLLPEFPEAEYQRGNVLLSLNKTDEAEKAFRHANKLREDWTLPMTSLGVLLVQKNEFAEAETLLNKATKSDPQNFSAYSALTELRLKTKAAPEVLKELLTKIQSLTSKAKPTAAIWSSRAALENTLGDKTAAKTSINHALSIDPKDKSALLERAEIALFEGDKATASETIKILFQIAPNSKAVKILQARIYAENGNAADAIKVLDSIENKTSDVVLLRDQITTGGSINTAYLEKQLEKDAKNAVILGRLCGLMRTENPAKALDYCRRASQAEPSNVNHAVGFGAALVQAKQYENAVAVFNRILQIAPDNFTAHANLATALFQLKRYSEAKKEFVWLTEKQPDLVIAYYFLGIAHDNLKEYLDAMANYQQFLRLADVNQNKLEIEKVNLRLPALQKLSKEKRGRKQ
ncbi:MAG: tetratricopeptide repeat protein [Pyrinomonadaceae bacterium]